MTDKPLDARNIFDGFQTRRQILARAGKMGIASALPLGLAACLTVPDNAYEDIEGVRYIRISDGTNCWGNQCFTYDAANRTVSVAGRMPATLPNGIGLNSGRIRETEFEALLKVARQARYVATGAGESSGEAASGGAGGNAGGNNGGFGGGQG